MTNIEERKLTISKLQKKLSIRPNEKLHYNKVQLAKALALAEVHLSDTYVGQLIIQNVPYIVSRKSTRDLFALHQTLMSAFTDAQLKGISLTQADEQTEIPNVTNYKARPRTPQELIVRSLFSGVNVQNTAMANGVAQSTVYRIVNRLKELGYLPKNFVNRDVEEALQKLGIN